MEHPHYGQLLFTAVRYGWLLFTAVTYDHLAVCSGSRRTTSWAPITALTKPAPICHLSFEKKKIDKSGKVGDDP